MWWAFECAHAEIKHLTVASYYRRSVRLGIRGEIECGERAQGGLADKSGAQDRDSERRLQAPVRAIRHTCGTKGKKGVTERETSTGANFRCLLTKMGLRFIDSHKPFHPYGRLTAAVANPPVSIPKSRKPL